MYIQDMIICSNAATWPCEIPLSTFLFHFLLFFPHVLSMVLQALKVIKKLMENFPIKRAPLRVRFTAPKPSFAGLMEKVAEWNATVISKDESGTQPSIVSLLILLFPGYHCVKQL